MHLAILKEQAEQEKQMVEEAKQVSILMRKVSTPILISISLVRIRRLILLQSFRDAEREFKHAVDKVPSG